MSSGPLIGLSFKVLKNHKNIYIFKTFSHLIGWKNKIDEEDLDAHRHIPISIKLDLHMIWIRSKTYIWVPPSHALEKILFFFF